jgi:hypothetical protein
VAASKPQQPASNRDTEIVKALMKVTIQIKMYTALPGKRPTKVKWGNKDGSYLLTSGLGSMVAWQGRNVILTHNHWGEALEEADYVDILDSDGMLLCELGKDALLSLVLYSDPGTLVLYNPKGPWLPSGNVAENENVENGDIVMIAHQDKANPGKVNIMQAKVVNQRGKDGSIILGVAAENGTIIPGDSGGGIWLDGKLVGNTWAIEKNRDQAGSLEIGLVAGLPSISIEIPEEANQASGNTIPIKPAHIMD